MSTEAINFYGFFSSDMIFSCTKLLRLYLWFYIPKMKILNISKITFHSVKNLIDGGRELERRGIWHQMKTHLAVWDFPRGLNFQAATSKPLKQDEILLLIAILNM